jgi:prevent-host-death family protein
MTVSMLEFRRNAEDVLRRVRKGQRMVLTYRGRPVARLVPVASETPATADPFYRLTDLADEDGADLTNAEIDTIVYGA